MDRRTIADPREIAPRVIGEADDWKPPRAMPTKMMAIPTTSVNWTMSLDFMGGRLSSKAARCLTR
jgi:hypothetical protein